MQSSTPVSLHVPIKVTIPGITMAGRLSIPRTATALTVCIEHPGGEGEIRKLTAMLAKAGIATLTLRAEQTLTLRDIVAVIDWIRSRRLLRSLPIGIIAPGAEGAAALKAAQHRPVAVPAVLVMSSHSTGLPAALRWLRGRLSAAPNAACHLSVAYSA